MKNPNRKPSFSPAGTLIIALLLLLIPIFEYQHTYGLLIHPLILYVFPLFIAILLIFAIAYFIQPALEYMMDRRTDRPRYYSTRMVVFYLAATSVLIFICFSFGTGLFLIYEADRSVFYIVEQVIWPFHHGNYGRIVFPTGLPVIMTIAIVFLMHVTLNAFLGYSKKSLSSLINLILPLTAVWMIVAFSDARNPQARWELAFWLTIFILLWFPGLRYYTHITSWAASIPLLIHYLLLGMLSITGFSSFIILTLFAYVPLAGYLLPRYRRQLELWTPKPLPRLKINAGLTLIELLIVVLILAIFSAAVANMSSAAYRAAERQETWRQSIQLAEEQIAWLRAQPQLPELGEYPIDPQVAQNFDVAEQSQYEISEGPADNLRRVRVTVDFQSPLDKRNTTLAAVLPAQNQTDAAP